MKQLFSILFIFLPVLVLAQQVNFEDGFTDDDFTSNPTWSGDTDNFIITTITGDPALDGNPVLRLNAPVAGSSYLSTPSTNVEGYWEFFVRMDFAPSNNNLTHIFLMSDTADLSDSSAINGYALRGGENLADDRFRLFKMTGGGEDGEVLAGATNISTGGSYRVKVTRDASGNWTLEVAEGYDGTLAVDATGTDNTYTSASHFGVRTKYTSTNTNRFYFDFKIDLPVPVIDPLLVNSFSVVSNNEIDIAFSKDIDATSVSASNFELNPGIKNPASFTTPSANSIRLTFADAFLGGENELSISGGISDLNGDTTLADTTFSFFLYDAFEPGHVVINEIMYDQPSGTQEYVELKNTTNKFLNLKDWKIANDRSDISLSSSDLVLHPDSFIVFTRDPAILVDIHGPGYYVNLSVPTLRNTGDQVIIYNNNGTMVDSVQYAPSWGGTKVALERRSSTVTGTIAANWGDSPSPLFGTPGKENLIESDTTPPEFKQLIVVNNEEIILAFSEAIKADSAESLSNYTLYLGQSNQSVLVSATLFAPDSVSLKFSPGLPDNSPEAPHSITIKHIEDVFGNINNNINTEFVIVNFGSFEPGDVVINEIMYDQPTGTPEYVELKNNSSKNLNLKGWKIGNDKSLTTASNSDLVLYPDSFVVFTTDASSLTSTHGAGYYFTISLPILVNGGDQVRVYNKTGATVDSLQYDPSWGGTKIALERIDSRLPSTIKANWGNSPSPTLGTPGKRNEVQPSTEGPKLKSTIIASQQSVKLTFDKFLKKAAAENLSNYSISPALAIQSISAQGEVVTINFSTNMVEGEYYTLTILNQADIFGNITASQTTELRYLDFVPPSKHDVVINEIMYLRSESDDPQFVELFNRSDKNIDLSDWILRDAVSDKGKIPQGTILAAGEYLVLTDKQYFAETISNALYITGFPSLNTAGDATAIITPNGVAVDSLYYSSNWGGDKRISLERKDPFAASNDASNWATSTAEDGSTPGIINSQHQEDNTPPHVIFANQTSEGVFVAFTEFISIRNDTEFKVSGNTITNFKFDSTQANKLLLYTPTSAKLKAADIEFQAINLYDVKGNKTAAFTQPVATPIQKGSVVINEILFEPLADANDNLPDQAQYIELYNPNDHAISLEGLVLTNAPDENNIVRVIEPVSSSFKWIPAKEYMLIYAENEATQFKNSKTAIYFDMENQSNQFTMRMNRTSLSLKTTGDAVYIADSTGAVIDSVTFSREWHNPNKVTTKGTSLERINPEGPSDDSSNWSSSTDSRGGTPGSQNSIYQSPGAPVGSTGISFSSNPFSPDNDGFEDNLFINYELDQADYLLHIRIFDRYGRKVRTLADGKAAGFSGNLIWDGLTDDRKDNRVGIYIVLFEAYNSAAGKKKVFKETVVLARKF
ncbi:MAG: lamin tail domain-containing protein [Balneolaceae bacterium]